MARPEQSINHQGEGPQEACGIIAIYSKTGEPISAETGQGLIDLERRGRDAAGMGVYRPDAGKTAVYKELGSPSKVFHINFDYDGHGILAPIAIGHNRYTSDHKANEGDTNDAQPMATEVNGVETLIAYNGNIPDRNRPILREKAPEHLRNEPLDTRLITNAIAHAPGSDLMERTKNGMDGVDGSYNLTMITSKGEMGAIRGPSGTMSLWVGEDDKKTIVASETVVDQSEGMKWRPVKPGEYVRVTEMGPSFIQLFPVPERTMRCVVQDFYTADRNGLIKPGMTYGEFRYEGGRRLARRHPIKADYYGPIPNGANDIAQGYADEMNVAVTKIIRANGKNTFIEQTQEGILYAVGGKFAVIDPEMVQGKVIVLTDETLIRGNTTGGDIVTEERKGQVIEMRRKIPDDSSMWVPDITQERGNLLELLEPKWGKIKGVVGLLREAGVKGIHIATLAPKVVRGCEMGYFIRDNQLVALFRNENGEYIVLTDEEVAAVIGADSVSFLEVDAIEEFYDEILDEQPCTECFRRPHSPAYHNQTAPVQELAMVAD